MNTLTAQTTIELDGSTFAVCVVDDCIDGRPSVEVVQAHKPIGWIGRGTVEHILPVVRPGQNRRPAQPCVEWWGWEVWIWLTEDQEHISTHIDVRLGQYVVLVHLEKS